LVCTLLIAPQTTEFGAKVALLGGLVIMCVFRPLFDRVFPAPGADDDSVAWVRSRLGARGPALVGRGAALTAAILVLGAGVVAAGTPARDPVREVQAVGLAGFGDLGLEVETGALPVVTVDPAVAALDSYLAGPGARELAIALLETLEVESAALVDGNRLLLAAVDHGFRLAKMDKRIDGDEVVVEEYSFDSLHLTVVFPYGEQGGASPGLEAAATLTEVTYDASGAEIGRSESTCGAITFAFVPSDGGRWLLVDAGTYDETPRRATRACQEL